MNKKFPSILYDHLDSLVPPIDKNHSSSELFLSNPHRYISVLKTNFVLTYSCILDSLSKFPEPLHSSDQINTFLLQEGHDPTLIKNFSRDTIQLLFKCIFSHPYILDKMDLLPANKKSFK